MAKQLYTHVMNFAELPQIRMSIPSGSGGCGAGGKHILTCYKHQIEHYCSVFVVWLSTSRTRHAPPLHATTEPPLGRTSSGSTRP